MEIEHSRRVEAYIHRDCYIRKGIEGDGGNNSKKTQDVKGTSGGRRIGGGHSENIDENVTGYFLRRNYSTQTI